MSQSDEGVLMPKPCPFCGTMPYVESYTYDGKWTQYKVECYDQYCPAQPTVDWHYMTEREAIEAWNRRA